MGAKKNASAPSQRKWMRMGAKKNFQAGNKKNKKEKQNLRKN
jgi:hypothetical protein